MLVIPYVKKRRKSFYYDQYYVFVLIFVLINNAFLCFFYVWDLFNLIIEINGLKKGLRIKVPSSHKALQFIFTTQKSEFPVILHFIFIFLQ